MNIPTDSEHNPVIVVNNYDTVDGRNALHTDVKALSLGLAKTDKEKNSKKETSKVDLSGKIWRQKDGESSPQIEELPLTRILDLAILVAQSSVYFQDAYRHEKFYDPENPLINIIGLQGNRMTVEVAADNPQIDEEILLFYDTLSKDGELYGERFRILKRLLDELGY